jgi:hypothetical protein
MMPGAGIAVLAELLDALPWFDEGRLDMRREQACSSTR